VQKSPYDLSPLALAMQWVSKITAIAMEMALPGLAGYWIDQRLGTKIVFLLLGMILGFAIGFWQLIKLAK
jgi:hypothetical protein